MHNSEHRSAAEQSSECIDQSELFPLVLLHVDTGIVGDFLLLVEVCQHSAVIRQKIRALFRRGEFQKRRRHTDPHQTPGVPVRLHARPRVNADSKTSSLAQNLHRNQNPMHRIVQIQRSRGTGSVFQKNLQLRLNDLLLLRPVIKFQTKQLF